MRVFWERYVQVINNFALQVHFFCENTCFIKYIYYLCNVFHSETCPQGFTIKNFRNNMANEKQVKQAIKQVLDSEYMNKMVTFDKGWKFKVKSYNIRTRSRFIPKDERDDYGCDVDANKFFIIEFNNAKDEMDATDAAAICLTLNPAGQIGTTGIPYDYEIESVMSDLDLNVYEKVLAIINNKYQSIKYTSKIQEQ